MSGWHSGQQHNTPYAVTTQTSPDTSAKLSVDARATVVLMTNATLIGGVALLPRTGAMVITTSRSSSRTLSLVVDGPPSPRPTMPSGPW
ncbi:hypothetical protein GUJ93_ZPchr0011g28255 [Zizania palustris]|uniref:Uncharacterized protein n=1 Tax=Zizania palustris TaxID=103762 RepID=A0A8J6BRT8_ZIZPA|nr:hypothetical protein GUJ93_ZPchr0011g28255 [Zizania palustris]